MNVLFSTLSRLALGPTQPIYWIPGAVSPGVKRPGREADPSLATSAEVKKMWLYAPTSWRSALLVKHRDSFILQQYPVSYISW
jgi:hypothetical protein